MANYGFDDLKIEFDNSGGSLVDMSQHVLSFNGIDLKSLFEESHAAGDSWVEQLFTGLNRGENVVLGGNYDDTATTGPDVIFNARGATRTLKVTWGGTKTTSIETCIESYKRSVERGAVTKYETTLLCTGAPTEV